MQNLLLSNRIKERCKQNKISVKSLLESCDMNRNTIYDLEKKCSFPSGDKLSRIADYLDCSVDYLLGRTDNPKVNRSAEKHTLAEYSEIAALGGSMTRDALIDDDFDTTLPEK